MILAGPCHFSWVLETWKWDPPQLSYLTYFPMDSCYTETQRFSCGSNWIYLISPSWQHMCGLCFKQTCTKSTKHHSKRLCTVTWIFIIPHMLLGIGIFTYFGKNLWYIISNSTAKCVKNMRPPKFTQPGNMLHIKGIPQRHGLGWMMSCNKISLSNRAVAPSAMF